MKFIISENKLQRYVFNQLNKLDLVSEIDKTDGEIFVRYNTDEYIGAFQYDPKTKELFVDPEIFWVFRFAEGVKGMENYEPIRVWFELKYDVPVDEVLPWDW